ncbi:MAG TPA: hypothetical protein VE987_09570 [Polyangiaceae bacterium]|nr:hypothetical protein [Polyangiaceae bacterium]
MPDPHVLYVVTAVVVLGLMAWVAVVLSRPSAYGPAGPKGASPPSPRDDHHEAGERPPQDRPG